MSDVRVFQAESLPAALAQVKKALGPDAVILGTRTIEGGMLRGTRVEITAGTAEALGPSVLRPPATGGARRPASRTPATAPAARGPAAVRSAGLHEALQAYHEELVAGEVSEQLAQEILHEAMKRRPAGIPSDEAGRRRLIQEAIAKLVPAAGGVQLVDGKVRTVAVVGPAGAGKTTTLAKLAANFKLRERKRVGLIAADMHRLNAGQQLERYGELIGAPVKVVQTVGDMHAAIDAYRRELFDLVLIDTPGLGLREAARFARVHSLIRASRADEVHLVLPVHLSESAQQRAAERFAPLRVSHLVLTHVDEAVGLGVVLSAVQRLQWKLSYLCDGQNVPRDLEAATSQSVAARIFPTERNRLA
jgi:flagellar biosynthesis protein FlhF